MQLSIAHSTIIAQGLSSNLAEDDSITRDGGGIVEYARINAITLQAWSPFQKGSNRSGVFLNSEEYAQLNNKMEHLAAKYGVTPAAVATGWITRHPAGIQVILGTTSPQHLTDAAEGSDLRLSRSEWYGLLQAAGHNVP